MQEQITLTRAELDGIVRESVKASVGEVRKLLGVPEDEDEARKFVRALHEARDFVDAWNDAKSTARRAFVKWTTVALLTGMLALLGWDKFVGK